MKRKMLTSVWAGLLLCAVGIMTAQASSTFITFSVNMATNLANGSFNPPPPAGTGSDTVGVFGTFNGYAPGFQLIQVGISTVYTNTYNDTADPNGTPVAYRFYINNTGSGLEPLSCYDNRAAYTPTNSGASLVLPTSFYGGNGPVISINTKFQVDMSEEIELGHFSKGGALYIAGSFNGWGGAIGNPQYLVTNDPSILITNFNFGIPGGLVESNVYTRTLPITTCANLGTGSGGLSVTNEIQEWKYVEMPGSSWETPGPFSDDHSGNRFFLDNTSQVLPIVSFSDLPYSPLANVTLNVDMSGVISYDTNYVRNSVSVWGTFNGFSSGIAMTNNPAAQNTNLFSAVVNMGEGSAITYQFRYTNSAVAASAQFPWVYDYATDSVFNNNSRRTISLPVTDTVLNTNVPAVFFLDLALDDYLPQATPVFFSVDMNGAVATNGIAFNPSSDDVYINGMFANGGGTPYPQAWYAWSGGANPVTAPAGYQMIREGSTTIYTNTIILPAGTVVGLQYQYGIDPGRLNQGPVENEAASGANHIRVVRSTVFNPYTMPADTFTNQPYQEPLFAPGNIYEGIGTLAGGNLNVGKQSGGAVPVTWLGRPGAHLQTKSSLASGSWQDIWATDGTNWTTGNSSINGFVSQTNWPTGGGTTFFRLVKP
jgi:hypothetical protein